MIFNANAIALGTSRAAAALRRTGGKAAGRIAGAVVAVLLLAATGLGTAGLGTAGLGTAGPNAVQPGIVFAAAGEAAAGQNAAGQNAAAERDVPLLRRQYVEEVDALAGKAEALRAEGLSSEQIARALHADRRALGVKYKNPTDPALLETIYARNEKKYGDRLGPTVEWLRAQGKSWEDIIASASRAGGRDINFNVKPSTNQ